jgi:hypothetical protein
MVLNHWHLQWLIAYGGDHLVAQTTHKQLHLQNHLSMKALGLRQAHRWILLPTAIASSAMLM